VTPERPDPLAGLRALVDRRAPALRDRLDLRLTGQDERAAAGVEDVTVEVAEGRLRIAASTVAAAAVGLARALETCAGADLSLDAPARFEIPDPLPDLPPQRFSTPLGMRYHLNPVAFGYTMAFWGWEQWERHIDWMALHGITAPLLLVGHEAVLVAMLEDLGMDRAAAARHVGGPAFLPWTTMGITHDLGAPLTDDALARRAELGAQIAARQRELGMQVVLPGFGGQLPAELAGTERTIEWQGWVTSLAAPGSELFAAAAAALHRHQRALLGTDHLYAVDPYIESLPPTTSEAELAGHAEAIYAGMREADPEAVWILQGWPFHYRRTYWTPERVRSLLSRVPEERLILLDLWGEHAPMWQDTGFLYGRRWLWCLTHSFGGRFGLFGDLAGLAEDLAGHRAGVVEGRRGRLEGVGITSEALDENALVFELALRAVWEPMPPVAEWTEQHLARRWGLGRERVRPAAELLLHTLYGPGRTRSTPSPLIARPWSAELPFAAQRLAGEALPAADGPPSANLDAENDTEMLAALAPLSTLVRELLPQCAAGRGTQALRHDLSQLALHVAAQSARSPLRAMLRAARRGDPDGIRSELTALEELMRAADAVAATRPELLVGRWIADARALAGADSSLAAHLERDARSLISVWGTQDSGLHDYSARHWSGPLADLHLRRWQAWGRWLAERAEAAQRADAAEPAGTSAEASAKPPAGASAGASAGPSDLAALRAEIQRIEEDWRGDTAPCPTSARGDLVTAAQHLLDLAEAQLPRLVPSEGGP
jgi:alpha-N-acetylglucosaminidase